MNTKADLTASLAVRPAAAPDAEALARLSGQLGYPSSREALDRRLAEILRRPEHAVFVAETHGDRGEPRIAGWIHAAVTRTVESDPSVEVCGLVVEESLRGGGIGERLLEEAERWTRCLGLSTIIVRSNVIRERAHAFYQRLGYEVVKSQRVFRKQIILRS
jgi:GNAT superfamily N-acetyltransferase